MGNGASADGSEGRTELFLRIAEKLKSTDTDLAKKLGGIFLFCVMKKQAVRYWTMDLNKVIVYPGEPDDDQEADSTFTLTEDTLLQIASGKVDARSAVQAGKCSVTGDIMRAMHLEPYIKL